MKTECIKLTELYDYIMNRLPAEKLEAVEKHMEKCENCYNEYIDARILLKKLDETDHIQPKEIDRPVLRMIYSNLKRFYQWVADMESDQAFAPVPVRSDSVQPKTETLKKKIVVQKDFENYPATMTFQLEGREKFSVQIEAAAENHEPEISVILEREGGKFEARQLENGRSGFKNLPFAEYRLTLESDGMEHGEFRCIINEAGVDEQ